MRIALLNWRDLTHPEGGGAERYAQTVCAGLARRGHAVTMFCAAHGDASAVEEIDGYRIVRRGGRSTVYPATLRALVRSRRAHGAYDVVIDAQNGLPFWAPLVTRIPVVSLVHHVHREQWPVVFGPVMARVGWLIESRISPRVYRGHPYVTVSGRSREELVGLGVRASDIEIIHNGTDRPIALGESRAARPTVVVLGRLVPHKRVELAIDVLARLLAVVPDAELRIVGDGWWRHRVEEHARASGVSDRVHFLGHVDEEAKHRELSRAWVALAPSAKEGWGLNVVEAASHGVPTVAHHGAGGLSESIVDGRTGVLVDDVKGMAEATARLLLDSSARTVMGHLALDHAATYTWEGAVGAWERLLLRVVGHPPATAHQHRAVARSASSPAGGSAVSPVVSASWVSPASSAPVRQPQLTEAASG
ncbi:MAG: glycosyltransferase family 4 protein [Humibacillus sp.]